MPEVQQFYTSAFVSGKKISIDKYKSCLFLEFTSKKATKFVGNSKEVIDWKDPKLKNIKTKLKKFDEEKGGISINCKDSNEVDDLLNGTIKKVYLGGWCEDDDVLEIVSL